MMRAPDPFLRLRIPNHGVFISSLRRRTRGVVLGAAAGGVAVFDISDAGGAKRVGKVAF